jgi:RHS repeat-associated protein
VLLLTAACLLLGAGGASAQNVQHTKNAPGAGMRSVFKVNPATNALELEVPLGPTGYPQRGGANVAPSINYSSRIWRVAYSGPIMGTAAQQGPPPVVGTRVVPVLAENSRLGWTYSLEAPYVETTAQDAMGGEIYDAWGNSLGMCTVGGTGNACCFIDRIRIHMPGGGTQEFRSSDHPYCYTSSGAPQLPPDLYSVDGSRMRFNRTSNTLYLPDGSYWVLPASATTPAQLFDRNGNRLLNGFTDGLGRTFPNPLAVGMGTDYTYTVPGAGGTAPTYTFRWRYLNQVLTVPLQPGQQLPNFSDDCGNSQCPEPNLFHSDTGASQPVVMSGGSDKINPLVLYQIVLPHDPSDPSPQTYTFTYDSYAEIDKVVYPTGGYERFAYGVVEHQQSGTYAYAEGNRGVTDRFVSAKGDGSDEVQWRYAWTDDQGQPHRGEITPAPESTRTERFQYYTTFGITFWSFTDARAGRPTEERVYDSAGQLIRRRLSEWAVTGSDNCNSGAYSTCTATRNPRLTKEVEVIVEPGGQALAKVTTYGYDLNYEHSTGANQTSVSEYDFVAVDQTTAQTGAVGSFSSPPDKLLRKTETAYLDAANTAYHDRHILGLPTSVTVKDGAGAVAAISTTAYDEPSYQLGNTYGAVANWVDPGAVRGNATTAGRWLNTTNVYVQAHAKYDQLGNVVVTRDADGNETQTDYSPAYSYAYPTSVTTAAPNPAPVTFAGITYAAGTFGSASGFTSYTDYDSPTGLVTKQTDVNGKQTTYDYSDPRNRLKRVDLPDGGRTTYNYVDAHPCGPLVETRTLLDDAGREVSSWAFFDGLGRPYLSESTDGQDASNPYLRVDTRYDTSGRVSQVSAPYRTPGCGAEANPSGRWTTNEYDALGRVKTVTAPDGASVTSLYVGNTVTVNDPHAPGTPGHPRRSVTDALGRLVRVDEPDKDSGALDSGGSPVQPTVYSYDVLGNLLTVTQGTQTRAFVYNSLSRLTSASNPESGTVSYDYDANGNLTARTDARGVQTTYKYDGLSRNIIVHYAGGGTSTPDVRHYYDKPAAGANGLGRPWWSEKVGVSANVFDQYDAAGRPTQYHQVYWTGAPDWGTPFYVSRAYDKAGGVNSQTYPSGHTVAYGYDAAGRVSGFTGNLGDGLGRTYADQISYSEFGGVRQERFGTQTPLYHKLHYNVRGQLYDVRLSSVGDEWNWNRGLLVNHYGNGDYANWGTSGPNNNGNVLRSHHYVPNDDQVSSYTLFYQDYEYDALNRLTKVTEYNSVAWQQQYVQAYRYDRWGNRTIDADQTSGAPEPQFDLNPAGDYREVPEPSNRLYAPGDNNRMQQDKLMQYDAAGNLVFDSYPPDQAGGGRVYDAENRMTAAADNSGNTAFYTYDADGRRVKRKIANEEWWQVYGMGGELLAEYRAGAPTFLPSKEYGYRGGELLVTMASGDDQRLRRFVTYLYYGALRRDPTAQELQDTSNQLAAAGAQGPAQLQAAAAQVARSLFLQTGYETSPYRTDAQYVTDLYYAYLQRAADDGGLGWWVQQLPGSGRANVCNAFEASPEFQAVVSTLYGTATSDDQRTDAFIERFYIGAYGRVATESELQQWRGSLNAAAAQGLSQVRAEAEAMGRSLYAGQVNDFSLTDQQFVTNLYEGFLQRGPDAGGLSFWTSNAAGGAQNRQDVLGAFATSPAFRELSGTLYREACWLVPDQLGTPRMVADKSGSLAGVKRHDYLPFGEELSAGAGGRLTTQGYSANDNVRQKFTGKERDNETGLDYFGARYYSSSQGRFGSCDPIQLSVQHIANTQRWNLYAYVNNNPLALTDPDGKDGQGKAGAKVIDIFIVATSRELRGHKIPDWNGLKHIGEQNGFDIRVHPRSESTLKNVTQSLKESAATVIITHALYNPGDPPNHRYGVVLKDGYLTDTGEGKDKGKNLEITGGKPEASGSLLAITGCNSADMGSIVTPTNGGYDLVVTDSRKDGETDLQGALDGAHDFVEGYVQGGIDEGIDDGNTAIRNTVRKHPMNRGDRLVHKKINSKGEIENP